MLKANRCLGFIHVFLDSDLEMCLKSKVLYSIEQCYCLTRSLPSEMVSRAYPL